MVVGGLPKESTEERYWDSIDGDELPRDPLSGSPGKPWYISPGGPVATGQSSVTVKCFAVSWGDALGVFPKKLHEES